MGLSTEIQLIFSELLYELNLIISDINIFIFWGLTFVGVLIIFALFGLAVKVMKVY